jgi:hypothetical protein
MYDRFLALLGDSTLVAATWRGETPWKLVRLMSAPEHEQKNLQTVQQLTTLMNLINSVIYQRRLTAWS